MKQLKEEIVGPEHVTTDKLWEDIGFTPAEAAELEVQSEIYGAVTDYIQQRGLTQKKLVKLLEMHQPDVSNLMRGRMGKFSVGRLIQIAFLLGIHVDVTVTFPQPQIVKAEVQKPKAKRQSKSGVALAA